MDLETAQNKVKNALNKSYDLFLEDSNWQPIISVRNQLKYIYDSLKGQNDRSKLNEVNIGLYAVREFENNYDEFADMLHDVSEITMLMKNGKF